MANTSFVERAVRVTIVTQRPDATGAIQPTVYQFERHRMRITIRQAGAQFGTAKVEIYGMPLDAMNNIARIWAKPLNIQNQDEILIETLRPAGFEAVFSGVITWSTIRAGGLPNVFLELEASSSVAAQNISLPPYATHSGAGVTLKDALAQIAKAAGFAVDFATTAPNHVLTDARAEGSAADQIAALMSMFPDLTYFFNLQRLVVRRANAPYEEDPTLISVATGMMNAPDYSSSSLNVSTLFEPSLRPGNAVKIDTIFDFVTKTDWVCAVAQHQLDVNLPGGAWRTDVACHPWSGSNSSN
ncbi:baseplate hub protein [Caballeronia novacaledonica]|uniref:Uncharacterized protein n=1 Tax=Caballeronia novacaledonica TaxID=1544861 RepID=A0AA37IJY0_9BURK|nr:hypothetical protein [Caballeronia novacaledonica]GJH28166.1 hypothetical protein CBA19CS42_26640 [Caballeronia novacaledonica]